MPFWNRGQKTKEERKASGKGNGSKEEMAREKHEQVLMEEHDAAERDAEAHEAGLERAEERRNEITEEDRRRIKAHNAIDERTDNVLERHEKILSERQNNKEADLESHEQGMEGAERRREENSQNELDRIKAHNAIDKRTDNVLERHDQILSDRQHAKEADLESHEQLMEVAERLRNKHAQNELDRIKAHNAIDERTDNVLERHDQILSDHQHAKEADLESHEKGMEVAEHRREENSQNELDRIKAHNAIDERTNNVLERHDKILSDRQNDKEADLESHEQGMEVAEHRREENSQKELDRIKAHNVIDERTDNALERHDQILSDRQHAKEADLESHEQGMEVAEHRREEISQNELDRIKAHNAIDERTDNVLERHDQILSDRQHAKEADLESHERGMEVAERRREEISRNELDRIKAHNAIDERTDNVLERHDQILSDRQHAKEADLDAHEKGMEVAERLRNEHAQNELDRIKAYNAIDERTEHVLDRHAKILSDDQHAKEADWESHEEGLEAAERLRNEPAQNELDRIKAHNAIEKRTDNVLERHDQILADRQEAEEADLKSHEKGPEAADGLRNELAQNERDRIKAHNAIEERTDNVLERHDQILADRQKAEEADLKSHEHGLEDAERRRTELSQNELDRIKAHNAIEERTDNVLERHEQILSDRQDAKEQDLKSHEHGLEHAERLRNEHSASELDQNKAHNAIEEKSKHVLEQRNRVLTDQQKSAERDIHKHEKALGQAEKRRASIRDEQIQSIKAYNNISESEQRAAEKREELAAVSYHSLEEDLANTEARMQRAEKVKSETIKNRALAAKETLMNLNDVRKRHEKIERESERNALMHFERVDDNVNRGIARRDSALGDSMDLSKTRIHPNQSSHANSSEVLNE